MTGAGLLVFRHSSLIALNTSKALNGIFQNIKRIIDTKVFKYSRETVDSELERTYKI